MENCPPTPPPSNSSGSTGGRGPWGRTRRTRPNFNQHRRDARYRPWLERTERPGGGGGASTAAWDDLVPRAAEAARPGAPSYAPRRSWESRGARAPSTGPTRQPDPLRDGNFRGPAQHTRHQPAPGGSGEPRRKRSVATWVAQEGSSPPRGYCSSAPWKAQLRIEPSLPLELVPGVFRGHTPRDYLARFPNGVVAPDPLATYCSDCGVLLVSETKHRALTEHGPDLEEGGDPTSVAAVRARMQRDPAYRAAILAPPAGSGNAVGPGVPTEEGGVPAARQRRSPVTEAPPARPNPEALRLWEGSPSCEAAVLQPAPTQHEEANASSDGDADMLDLGCGEPDDTDEHAARLQKLLEELEAE
ncbi:hypothetical protein HPB48_000714 [Haemaphysalis longicornis]|uniref:Uncharacterized protein n=1 Tax=Haemaphysalis longicornis TaxID=44386 RepID=A0A9J6GLD3_HAELO|nr:hypothetical protein HPB48_000714 [Haemaphysalis longicornis]